MIQIVTILLIASLVGIDQLIKFLVVNQLQPIGEKMLIPGFIQLHYVENDGAMMGLMQGKTTFMIIAAAAVLIILFALIFSKKIKFGFLYICLVMVVSGGIGNIIDRIFRGFVVDYIEVLFVDFYVFNFADCLVTVSAFLIIGYEIYDLIKDSKRKKVSTND